MTNLKISTKTEFLKIISLVFLVILFASSCTKKLAFLNSSVVPAARGTVQVRVDDNKNHTIDIALLNLAEPERLSPPKNIYMVWMETNQGETKNIGQIKSDNSTFSKTLKANFKTVTSFTPVKIFITAENDVDVQSPDWQVILTTARF